MRYLLLSIFATMAHSAAIMGAGAASIYTLHQPKLPDELQQ